MEAKQADKKICTTRYPIVLIHGIGHGDDREEYWGRIPEALRERGATVLLGGQGGSGRIEDDAARLAENLRRAAAREGIEKFNLIGHSKGGLDARYAVSMLGLSGLTASVTTIATPHRGVATIDEMARHHDPRLPALLGMFGLMLRMAGGESPEIRLMARQFSAEYMDRFNRVVTDAPGVMYQSYAFDMRDAGSDVSLALFHSLVSRHDGRNAGLVDVGSARWGDFRGIVTGIGRHGISHPQAVDGGINVAHRGPLDHRDITVSDSPDGPVYGFADITLFYILMVRRLRTLGF